MLNGLFRAIQLSHFPWHCNDFESLVHQSQLLIQNDCIQEISLTLETVIQSTDSSLNYAKRLLSRYSIKGYPLSGNGVIFGLTTLMRNMLSRAILLINSNSYNNNHDGIDSTLMTFDDVWDSLGTNKMEISKPVTDYVRKALRKTYVMSLQYFSELTVIMEKIMAQNTDYPAALYAREIMSASLVFIISLVSLFPFPHLPFPIVKYCYSFKGSFCRSQRPSS